MPLANRLAACGSRGMGSLRGVTVQNPQSGLVLAMKLAGLTDTAWGRGPLNLRKAIVYRTTDRVKAQVWRGPCGRHGALGYAVVIHVISSLPFHTGTLRLDP